MDRDGNPQKKRTWPISSHPDLLFGQLHSQWFLIKERSEMDYLKTTNSNTLKIGES